MAEASCKFKSVGAFLLSKRKEAKWNKLSLQDEWKKNKFKKNWKSGF